MKKGHEKCLTFVGGASDANPEEEAGDDVSVIVRVRSDVRLLLTHFPAHLGGFLLQVEIQD